MPWYPLLDRKTSPGPTEVGSCRDGLQADDKHSASEATGEGPGDATLAAHVPCGAWRDGARQENQAERKELRPGAWGLGTRSKRKLPSAKPF